jgi:uncharacterized membrane protein
MSVFDKGFVTLLACSGLLIVVAIPLVLRKVPRNVVYGFRTRATMANDKIWFEANAHFGRGLIVSSLCAVCVAGVLYAVQPFPPEIFLPVSLLVLAAPTLIAVLATVRFIRSLGSHR